MPAKSKAQRRFFAMASHSPEMMKGKMPEMSKEKMHEYSETSEKGLPAKMSKLASKRKKKKAPY